MSRKKTKARLNILLDPDLKDWAHRYSRKLGTTITHVIVAHLLELRKNEHGTGIKQI